jgi:hypothetical protein
MQETTCDRRRRRTAGAWESRPSLSMLPTTRIAWSTAWAADRPRWAFTTTSASHRRRAGWSPRRSPPVSRGRREDIQTLSRRKRRRLAIDGFHEGFGTPVRQRFWHTGAANGAMKGKYQMTRGETEMDYGALFSRKPTPRKWRQTLLTAFVLVLVSAVFPIAEAIASFDISGRLSTEEPLDTKLDPECCPITGSSLAQPDGGYGWCTSPGSGCGRLHQI